MESIQPWATLVAGIAAGVVSVLRYLDSAKFKALRERALFSERKAMTNELRIATLEREVAECHSARIAGETQYRELAQLVDDKMIRMERERDIAVSDVRLLQHRIIELQERVQELRKLH